MNLENEIPEEGKHFSKEEITELISILHKLKAERDQTVHDILDVFAHQDGIANTLGIDYGMSAPMALMKLTAFMKSPKEKSRIIKEHNVALNTLRIKYMEMASENTDKKQLPS